MPRPVGARAWGRAFSNEPAGRQDGIPPAIKPGPASSWRGKGQRRTSRPWSPRPIRPDRPKSAAETNRPIIGTARKAMNRTARKRGPRPRAEPSSPCRVSVDARAPGRGPQSATIVKPRRRRRPRRRCGSVAISIAGKLSGRGGDFEGRLIAGGFRIGSRRTVPRNEANVLAVFISPFTPKPGAIGE